MTAVAVACCDGKLRLLLVLRTRLFTNGMRLATCPVTFPSGDTTNAVPSVIKNSKLITAILITRLRPFGGRIVRGLCVFVPRITTGWRSVVVVLLVDEEGNAPVWISGRTRVTFGGVIYSRFPVVSGEDSVSVKGPEI